MKKVLLFIRNLLELYIPVASFLIMFMIFIVQVFFRYVIRHPLTWSMEVTVIGFIWTVIFGACYTMRRRSHVKFTMIYDRLKPRPAAILRMLGNLILVIAFSSLVYASIKYSFFVGFQKTPVFRIPFTYMYLPFVYFLCSFIIYTITEIIEDINVLKGIIPDSPDHKAGEELV
jgi:TRAP-type C4-dicarboxylate transport system permease small subunit